MGLDMYLTGRKYLNKWEDGYTEIAMSMRGIFPETRHGSISEIRMELMYWRKANAIHRWFVENVQDGKDDCGEYYVSMENLILLRDTCKQVIDNPSLGEGLLPTADGFFFGNTEYDEDYLTDIMNTYNRLSELIYYQTLGDQFKHWDFYYRASW